MAVVRKQTISTMQHGKAQLLFVVGLLVSCHVVLPSDLASAPGQNASQPAPLSPSASNRTQPEEDSYDEEWMNIAIRDIAYYLRAHKFNDFDRRFHIAENNSLKTQYVAFPDPPLRSLHWEVRKYCELGFVDCVHFLHEKVLLAEMRRVDDTATVIHHQRWDNVTHATQVQATDTQCKRLYKLDWIGAQPFQGPLERFQWRTTASYYMCWFTMNLVPALTLFGEPCDNFASCLDPEFGASNLDPRADDRLPFQCAAYSFCPDPCCPHKRVASLTECWHSPSNPCFTDAPEDARQCSFKNVKNQDFRSIALNRWNVSCVCNKEGFEWDSKYGICIDIDECLKRLDSCNHSIEACFNLPGSYQCGCRWGYLFNQKRQQCERFHQLLVQEVTTTVEKEEEEKSASLVKSLINQFSPAQSSSRSMHHFLSVSIQYTIITVVVICVI